MSRLREMHRKDGNHEELVALARKLGAQWFDGPPLDGWLGTNGFWVPTEFKMPERRGKPDEFTDQQIEFFAKCRLYGTRWAVWYSEKDVLNTIKEFA